VILALIATPAKIRHRRESYTQLAQLLRVLNNDEKNKESTQVIVLGVKINTIAIEARLNKEKLYRVVIDTYIAINKESLTL
jgi:hypothetical protein